MRGINIFTIPLSTCRWAGILIVMGCFLFKSASGQVNPDSLVEYSLSEIVIGGEIRHADYQQRLFRVRLATLAQQDKADIAGVLNQLPSAHVQTNSRGETLVYVRGAGDRQVAIFLDGAPLNIGWDNRIDLSMIPANVLGNITLERGAVSSAYGPNVSGGAINLLSRSLEENTAVREGTFQYGDPSSWQTRLMAAGRKGKTSIMIGGNITKTDGFRVPDSANLPFGQSGSIRTNSDRESAVIYGRFGREGQKGSLGLTLFHTVSEKGVAPEGHLNPALEDVRYWRYPRWRNTMAIFNAVKNDSPVHLFTTVWASRFNQEIDQYLDESFSEITFQQEDVDYSGGVRAVAEWKVQKTSIRGIGYVSSSSHDQVDVERSPTGEIRGPKQLYSNVLYSVGSEIARGHRFGGQWVVGATMDGMTTPSTFDKPRQPTIQTWSVNSEADVKLSKNSYLLFNAGSKPRFPTLRELYGVALNRFVLNDDLKSERSWMSEVGYVLATADLSFQITGFVVRTMDTIDQRNVIVDGKTKRQRVNLDGSRVLGFELSGAIRITDWAKVEGHATWMRPRLIDGKTSGHLTEKPETLMTLNGELNLTPSSRLTTTAIYVGKAYGLGTGNEHSVLPTSLELNARLSKTHYFNSNGLFIDAFAGVDNLFDSLTLPQLGLPSPGRSLRIGLNLSY